MRKNVMGRPANIKIKRKIRYLRESGGDQGEGLSYAEIVSELAKEGIIMTRQNVRYHVLTPVEK